MGGEVSKPAKWGKITWGWQYDNDTGNIRGVVVVKG